MFPDSNIAKSHRMSDTKAQYLIKFGIAHYLKRRLIYDVSNTPYLFLFDKITNSQVKKQYDVYLLYWSNHHNKVVHSYVRSLFVGHCKPDDLAEHYNEFFKIMQLDSNYLLHIGMDEPNVNLSFESKFATNVEEMDITFLRFRSCSLHPFIVAWLTSKIHNILILVTFLMTFISFSNFRVLEEKTLETITYVVAAYAKEHTETRWLSMKYIALPCLDQ